MSPLTLVEAEFSRLLTPIVIPSPGLTVKRVQRGDPLGEGHLQG